MKDHIETLISQLNTEIAKEGDSGLCFVAPEFLAQVVNILKQSSEEIERLEADLDGFIHGSL